MNNPKIEVFLTPDTSENLNDSYYRENPYFYCILDWDDNVKCWYNTGICGWSTSPEGAFADGMKYFQETKDE